MKKKKKYNIRSYQFGGSLPDWFKDATKPWQNVFKDPYSASSQNYLNGLLETNTSAIDSYNTNMTNLKEANKTNSGIPPIYDNNGIPTLQQTGYTNTTPPAGWEDLTRWEKFNSGNATKSPTGFIEHVEYDSGTLNKNFTNTAKAPLNKQMLETGAGIFGLLDSQKKYDSKPLEKFSQNTMNNRGIMRMQAGGKVNNNINPTILSAIESNLKNDISSNTGATGYMMLTQGVLDEYNQRNKTNYTKKDVGSDGKLNIDVGNWYVNNRIPELLENYGIEDNIDNRLAAYYQGAKNVKNSGLNDVSKSRSEYYRNAIIDDKGIKVVGRDNEYLPIPDDFKTYNQDNEYQMGGNIPTSLLGLHQYPMQPVNVPSNDISMEGINYPVLALPNNDKPVIMKPNKKYKFPRSKKVLELPLAKYGMKVPRYQDGGNPMMEVNALMDKYIREQENRGSSQPTVNSNQVSIGLPQLSKFNGEQAFNREFNRDLDNETTRAFNDINFTDAQEKTIRERFNNKFAKARARGEETFTFDGKLFTTETKEEQKRKTTETKEEQKRKTTETKEEQKRKIAPGSENFNMTKGVAVDNFDITNPYNKAISRNLPNSIPSNSTTNTKTSSSQPVNITERFDESKKHQVDNVTTDPKQEDYKIDPYFDKFYKDNPDFGAKPKGEFYKTPNSRGGYWERYDLGWGEEDLDRITLPSGLKLVMIEDDPITNTKLFADEKGNVYNRDFQKVHKGYIKRYARRYKEVSDFLDKNKDKIKEYKRGGYIPTEEEQIKNYFLNSFKKQ